jgi:hypothetical protein
MSEARGLVRRGALPKIHRRVLTGEMYDRTPRKPSFGRDGQIASFEAIGATVPANACSPYVD